MCVDIEGVRLARALMGWTQADVLAVDKVSSTVELKESFTKAPSTKEPSTWYRMDTEHQMPLHLPSLLWSRANRKYLRMHSIECVCIIIQTRLIRMVDCRSKLSTGTSVWLRNLDSIENHPAPRTIARIFAKLD